MRRLMRGVGNSRGAQRALCRRSVPATITKPSPTRTESQRALICPPETNMTPVAQQAGEPTDADAEIKAAYITSHGSDMGWLGIEGSYFIAGWSAYCRARLASRPQQPQAETPLPEPGLREAAQALLDKLDAARPHVIDMCLDVANHGRPYRGPAYMHETESLRAALSNTGAHPPEAEPKPICRTCGAAGCSATCGFSDYASPPEARADAGLPAWQPIETAPKDTNILGYCPRLGITAPVSWDDNKYAKKPRPYWTHWGERVWGTTWIRNDQPTHWMPLPLSPEAQEPKT